MGRVILSLFVAMVLIGCGEGGMSGGVDSNKTVEQIVQDVKQMDMAQLQAKIDQYGKAIEAKSAELAPLMEELKKIPVTQMLGEDAKKIKADIEEVKSAIKVLNEKMSVYVTAMANAQNK